ncbi:MAG: gliding motility protein GldE [Phycisphaerae bacterium]|nr:MAG: gliding motility protein GldE [Phycisphaerae bacterium]
MSAEAWLAVAVVTLGIGSVLSCLVQSLRDLSKGTLEEIAAVRGDAPAAARVDRILEDQEGHAAAVAMVRTVCNLLFTIAMVMWVTRVRGATAPDVPELLIAAAVASILLWVFGLALPNAVAKHAGESTVYAWSSVLRAAYLVGKPLAAMARAMDEVVRRLSGKPKLNDAQAAAAELLTVVEDATSEGKVDQTEAEMIEAVVHLRDKTVAQIMTPRTEVEAVELCESLSDVTAAIRRTKHSRIPVYEGSLDRVAGVFYVKDLVRWLAGEGSRTGKTFDFRAMLRPAFFIPETKTVRETLDAMLAKRTHLAIVADEYGGTAGLVTIEDIIEEVFGDITDEHEPITEEVPEVRIDASARAAELDARLNIHDANDALKPLHTELPESEDYDTVGGFVTVTLGRIPSAGETFRHDGLVVTVLEAEPTRVTRVRVEPSTVTADAEDAAS